MNLTEQIPLTYKTAIEYKTVRIDVRIASGNHSLLVYNGYYSTFTADFCRASGLPMYNADNYDEVADLYISETRMKKSKLPLNDDTEIVAWYRVSHGYVPLYKAN